MDRTLHELSILLAGEAGAGINSTESVLTAVFKKDRRHVFAAKEYMSRVRGGTNSTTIRAASTRVTALSGTVDIFIPLDADAFARYKKNLQDATLVLADPGVIDSKQIHPVAFNAIAESCGSAQYAGVVAAGTVAAIAGLDRNILADQVRRQFEKTGAEVVAANIKAA